MPQEHVHVEDELLEAIHEDDPASALAEFRARERSDDAWSS